jgi:tryptophan synthase alpha chain
MPGRLTEMFGGLRDRRAALIAYATGFYPEREGSRRVIEAMLEAGADAVEIGIPFSDPVLDGQVIQRSSAAALAAGATVAGVLELVSELRRGTDRPLLLMSYYNPILRYGLEGFARDSLAAGADAVVIPDLPVEEMSPWHEWSEEAGLETVAFCSFTTGAIRMREAGRLSSGFLYCVSLLGTTGPRDDVSPGLEPFLERVREHTTCPIGVGLGISTPEQCSRVGGMADAVIVGSALVRLVQPDGGPDLLSRAVEAFARSLAVPSGTALRSHPSDQ